MSSLDIFVRGSGVRVLISVWRGRRWEVLASGLRPRVCAVFIWLGIWEDGCIGSDLREMIVCGCISLRRGQVVTGVVVSVVSVGDLTRVPMATIRRIRVGRLCISVSVLVRVTGRPIVRGLIGLGVCVISGVRAVVTGTGRRGLVGAIRICARSVGVAAFGVVMVGTVVRVRVGALAYNRRSDPASNSGDGLQGRVISV